MSELQEIEVIIDSNGNVQLKVRGAKGKSCLELTHKLEQLLGGKISDRQITDEMNEVAGNQDDLNRIPQGW